MEKRRGGGAAGRRGHTRAFCKVCVFLFQPAFASPTSTYSMRGWQAWILFAAGDEVDELKTRRLILGTSFLIGDDRERRSDRREDDILLWE